MSLTKSLAVAAVVGMLLGLNGAWASTGVDRVETERLSEPEKKLPHQTSVEGFSLSYASVKTPRADWNKDYAATDWFEKVTGKIVTQQSLSYRKVTLPAGSHDVWIESGEKGWYYLRVGNRSDAEAPRLKAAFKLYEQEEGVETVNFHLKLVSKATKLKFSIRAGQWEGHGNLRIRPSNPNDKGERTDKGETTDGTGSP